MPLTNASALSLLIGASNRERGHVPFTTEDCDMADEEVRETQAGASADTMPPELAGMTRADLMHFAKMYLKRLHRARRAGREASRKMTAAYHWLVKAGLIEDERIMRRD